MKSVLDFSTEKGIEPLSNLQFEESDLIFAIFLVPVNIRGYLEMIDGDHLLIKKEERREYKNDLLTWFSANPLMISNNYESRSIPLIVDLMENSDQVTIKLNPLSIDFLFSLIKAYQKYQIKHSFIVGIQLKSKYAARILKYVLDHDFIDKIQMNHGELCEILKLKANSYPSLKIIESKIMDMAKKQFKEIGIKLSFERIPRNYSRFGLMKLDYSEFFEWIEEGSVQAFD